MTIRAVFFDMGGTIETFARTAELCLQATPGLQNLLISAGIDLGLSNEKLCEVVLDGFRRYHTWSIETADELSPLRVWSEFVLPGYPVEPGKLAEAAEDLTFYYEARFYQRELRPEAPSVLDAIQKLDLKIGLISNVCSRNLVPVNLDRYGIRHYFDPIVLSSTYGRRKPDPAIFHYAARLANVPTSKCIYVGDRIARDVIGAHKAGFQLAVQIHNDFDHGEPDNGDVADASITHMDELLEIVKAEYRKPDVLMYKASKNPDGGIRAILFDAGDILYYRKRTGRKLAKFLTELGLNPKNITPAEKRALQVQSHRGLIGQEQFHEAILRLHGVTQPEHIERGKRIMAEEDNAVHIFSGVPETLYSLKNKGFMLGIITDTAQPLHVKLNWFERGGFGNVWDSIISSAEMRVSKPHPAIYRTALQQLGVCANQAVFVGHKTSELDGAQSVGMKTVAFNYDQDAKADFYIEKFEDLLKVPVVVVE
jgi:putative hydrolase of the HAD superfamily